MKRPSEVLLFCTALTLALAPFAQAQESGICKAAVNSYIDENEVAYDAVYSSGLFRRCRRDVNDLLDLLKDSGGLDLGLSAHMVNDAAQGKPIDGIGLIDAYASHCLVSPYEVSNGAFQDMVEDILAHLIIFRPDQPGDDTVDAPFCNGLMVGSRVYTARHCLLMEEPLSGTESIPFAGMTCNAKPLQFDNFNIYRIVDKKPEEVVVAPQAGQTFTGPDGYVGNQDKICKTPEGPLFAEKRSAIFANDWVGLSVAPVEAKPDGYMNQLDFHRKFHPKMIEYMLVSSNKFLTALSFSKNREITFEKLAAETLSIDTSPLCAPLVRSENGAYVHGCQTQDTASGAPMIAYVMNFDADGHATYSWTLFGVNTGTGAFEQVCHDSIPLGDSTDGYVNNGGLRVHVQEP